MYFVIPYPILNGICLSGPLFVLVMDYYLNGVTINQSQIKGVIAGFIGVLVMINSDLIMSWIDPTYTSHTTF